MKPIRVMKTSEVLRRAKKFLWGGVRGYEVPEGKGYGICTAIFYASRDNWTWRQRDALINKIGASIRPYIYVEDWLMAKGVPYQDLTKPKLQKYRKRWLEHLAALYEAKGD